jgi:hypothetical protein
VYPDSLALPSPDDGAPDRPDTGPFRDPPDAFGLTKDDWISLSHGGSTEFYGRTAMLWWALAGVEDDDGPVPKTDAALTNFLVSIHADVRALMVAASSARNRDVRSMAGSLENVCRRLELAAEISEALLGAEYDRASHAEEKAPRLPPGRAKKKR